MGRQIQVEFLRSRNIAKGEHGRIYWAKYFAAPKGLDYDVNKFSAWYDQVVRLVQKAAAGKVKRGSINVYYLPTAWDLYQGRAT